MNTNRKQIAYNNCFPFQLNFLKKVVNKNYYGILQQKLTKRRWAKLIGSRVSAGSKQMEIVLPDKELQ